MISWKMIQVLREIKKNQRQNGVCKAREINTYKDPSTLYRSLERLHQINAVQKQQAPKNHQIKNTYTITQFGKKLVKKADTIKDNG